DEREWYELGDVLITRGRFRRERSAGFLGFPNRHDLDDWAGRQRRESLDLEDRLEDAIGLVYRDLRRRDHGDLATHFFFQYEILTGDLADELHQHADLDVLEVHRDELLLGNLLGRASRCDSRRSGGGSSRCGRGRSLARIGLCRDRPQERDSREPEG